MRVICMALKRSKWIKSGNYFYSIKKNMRGLHLKVSVDDYGHYRVLATVREIPKSLMR